MNRQEEKDRELRWEEVSCEHIVQDKWIDFRRQTFRFPNGEEFSPFYTYSRRDYVVIVAEDTEHNFLCVRQFRQGIRRVTVEFPAGGIECSGETDYSVSAERPEIPAYDQNGSENSPSTESSENALSAAKRELAEETGYVSEDWTHLLTIPSNATIADNYAHVYYARNCRKASGLHLDDTEFLEPEKYSSEEIEEMIADGSFPQAIHVMAWLLAKQRI